MKIGDYVWFNKEDDLECGNLYEAIYVPGKLIKEAIEKKQDAFWVTTFPQNGFSWPLWIIPCSKIRTMSREEAMMVILENSN